MITLHNIAEYDNEINKVIHLIDKTKSLYSKIYFRDEYQLNNALYNCYTGSVDYIEAFEYAVIKLEDIFKKVQKDKRNYQYTESWDKYQNALYSIKIIYDLINACNEYIKSTYTYPDKIQKAVIRKSNFIKDAKQAAKHINLLK